LRNLLTALAGLIVVAAGAAYYFVTNDASSVGSTQATPSSAVVESTTTPGAAATSPSTPAQSAQVTRPEVGPDDHVLGKIDAPITIIEYASYTCPHCARFHTDILPHLKSDFIDKGQARLAFREIVRNGVDVAAAQLVRCAAPEAYLNLVEVLFRSQESWAFVEKPLDALKQIGRTAGLDPVKMDQCFADEALSAQLIAQNKTAFEKYNVEATPTIFLNGVKYSAFPYEDYDEGGEKKPGLATSIKNLLPKP
jgi:protein-disulfide isomerase